MTYKTIIPTASEIKKIEENLKYYTVENLNPEAVEGYSQKLKEELVADTLETMISWKNGTLQFCEGEISDILDGIIEENTKARNALKLIKRNKVKALQYLKIHS